MRTAVVAFLTSVFIFNAGYANAQSSDAEVRSNLAERLIDATARESLDKIMEEAVDRQAATLVELSDEQRAWYSANALPIFRPHLQTMIDDMEAQYAEAFTAAELTALVAFYETPEGRVIARKQSQVGAMLGENLGEMARAYVSDLLTKFCATFDCPSSGVAANPSKDD